jgi:hypothetical protein
MTENSDIMARATELATANPPHVSFSKLGVLLENLFFGVFRVLGWAIGRLWFHGSRTMFVVGLAFADGYRQGAKAQPEIAPPPPPPAPVDLLEDDRIADHMTPFGVPFGPNVFASHD